MPAKKKTEVSEEPVVVETPIPAPKPEKTVRKHKAPKPVLHQKMNYGQRRMKKKTRKLKIGKGLQKKR